METAIEVASRLDMSGHRAVVVGGAIRDTILCREVRDVDIATSATMGEIVSLLPGCKVIGKPPTTAALLAVGGAKLDIASFQGSGLEDDLARRDLTINSMAMTPAGEIIDPWGGSSDIASGVLRFTGKPDHRLHEDPLRAVRLARFASILPHFSMDPSSAAACPKFAPDVASIPLPRIGKEILLALGENLPLFLESLETLGVLEAALPFDGKPPHPTASETLRRVDLAAKITTDPGVRAACLLHGTGEKRRDIAVSWGWPRNLVREIESLGKWGSLACGKIEPELFGHLFRTKGSKWIDRLFLLGLVDCLAGHREQMEIWIANRMKASMYSLRLDSFGSRLTGEDIMDLADIESGHLVGEAISAMYGAIAEGYVKDREDSVKWAGSWIKKKKAEIVL